MSAEKTLEILDVFTLKITELTVPEIADKLNQPVSSVYRHLRVLKEKGLVLETQGGSYKLGYRILEMANIVRSDITISEISFPKMRELTRLTGETSILTVVSGLNAVCIGTVPTFKPIKVSSEQGKILPLYGGASSKILLAYQQDEVVDELFNKNIIVSHTPNTLTDKQELRKNLQEIIDNGYAISDQEIDEGVYAVGVPIKDMKNEVIAGLSVAGPRERIIKQDLQFYVRTLQECAVEIQKYL
jgi:DNA-binding IclR family transcriptional regulator